MRLQENRPSFSIYNYSYYETIRFAGRKAPKDRVQSEFSSVPPSAGYAKKNPQQSFLSK